MIMMKKCNEAEVQHLLQKWGTKAHRSIPSFSSSTSLRFKKKDGFPEKNADFFRGEIWNDLSDLTSFLSNIFVIVERAKPYMAID